MEYDNNLTGALWPEDRSEVLARGNLEIDGEKKYCILVKSKNNEGREKFELMISAGLIHKNEIEPGSKSPHFGGKTTIDGKSYKFGAWNRTPRSGGPDFLSASLREQAPDGGKW